MKICALLFIISVNLSWAIYDPEDLSVKPLTIKKQTWRKIALRPEQIIMHHNYSRVEHVTPKPPPKPDSNRQPKSDPHWQIVSQRISEDEPIEPEEERPEQRISKPVKTNSGSPYKGLEKMNYRGKVDKSGRLDLEDEEDRFNFDQVQVGDAVQIDEKLDKFETSGSTVHESKIEYIPSTGISHLPALTKEIEVFGFHWPPRDHEVYPFKSAKPYSNMAFEKCPKKVTGQLVFQWSCFQFLNCWNGRGYVTNCAPGTLFNPVSLECDFPEKVTCITGTHNQKVRSEYVEENHEGFICQPEFSGLLPHPRECTKFLNCVNGQTYIQNCGPGTVFNPKISACDQPYNTDCEIELNIIPNYNSDVNDTRQSRRQHIGDDRNRKRYDHIKITQQNNTHPLPTLKEVQSNYTLQFQPGYLYHTFTNQSNEMGHTHQTHQKPSQFFGASTNQTSNYQQIMGQAQTNQPLHLYGTFTNQNHTSNYQQIMGQHHQTTHQSNTRTQQPSGCCTNQQPNGHASPTNIHSQTTPFQPHATSTNHSHTFLSGHAHPTIHQSQTKPVQGHSTVTNQTHYQRVTGRGYQTHPSGTPLKVYGTFTNQNQSNFAQIMAQGQRESNLRNTTQSGQGYGWKYHQIMNSHPQGGRWVGYMSPPQHNFNQNVSVSRKNCTQDTLQGSASTYPGVRGHYIVKEDAQTVRTGRKDEGTVKCARDFTGLQPHPYICEKFLNCANGATFIQDCGPGTVFNPKTLVCDWPHNVNCKKSGYGEAKDSSRQEFSRNIGTSANYRDQAGAASQQQPVYANLPDECQEVETQTPGTVLIGFGSPTTHQSSEKPQLQTNPSFIHYQNLNRGTYPTSQGYDTPIPQYTPPSTPVKEPTFQGGYQTTPRVSYSMSSSVSSSRGDQQQSSDIQKGYSITSSVSTSQVIQKPTFVDQKTNDSSGHPTEIRPVYVHATSARPIYFQPEPYQPQYRPNLSGSTSQTSGQQTSGHQTSGQQTSGHQTSTQQGSGHQTSGHRTAGQQGSSHPSSGYPTFGHQTFDQTSGHQTSGHQTFGHQTSGQQTSGQQGSGRPVSGYPAFDHKTGQQGFGHQTAGYPTFGHQTFDQTSVQQASGQQTSGHQTFGHQNSGQQTSGHQTSGHPASGYPVFDHKTSGQQISGHQTFDQTSGHQTLDQTSGQQGFGHQTSGYPSFGHQTFDQTSGQQASGQQTSGHQISGQQTSGQQGSVRPAFGYPAFDHKTSGQQASGHQTFDQTSGQQTSGHQISGQQTSGQQGSVRPAFGYPAFDHKASGQQASGHQTFDQTSGQQGSGHQDSGYSAFGHRTFDHQTSGQQTSGHQTSGHQTFGHQTSHQTSGHQTFYHPQSTSQPPTTTSQPHYLPHLPIYFPPEPQPSEPLPTYLTRPQTKYTHVQKIPARKTGTIKGNWPPPFLSTDTSADYVFEDETTTTQPIKVWKTSNLCGEGQFQCDVGDCIPNSWLCNGLKDCPHGEDEENCNMYLEHFTLQKKFRLYKHEIEKWLNTDLDTCSQYCINSKSFECKSFNFRRDDNVCLLCDTNVGLSGALAPSPHYDYYERTAFTVNCTNRYECSNQKCINFTQVCDGNDDCGNRMDEKFCDAASIGYDIRLAGSPLPSEGRIEIRVFDEWGYICDDQFGLRDAHVACKELGFSLGALDVKTGSYFAPNIRENETFYLMDDVACLGNETSLRDCDFNGWGVHNCMPQEIVGVVCKTPENTCQEEYWQCDTSKECLPLDFVCDGVFDCEDQSDEGAQHCDAPVEIRLANGTTKMEGRVEVKYHGIWGTICDDDFGDMAAKVICRSLGFHGSALAKKDGAFGPGKGPIWLDQVNCYGNESYLQDCVHWHWGEHNCEHAEDAAVICSKENDSIYEKKSKDETAINMDTLNAVSTSDTLYPVRCGHRNEDFLLEDEPGYRFRVVSGSVAKRGEYPWQATIRVKGKTKSAHWCGAVVISNKFVLTAAHCLVGFSKGAYFIRAGDYDVDTQEGTEVEAYIEDFFIHEKFRQGGHMNNDLALIKLKGIGLRLSKHVQPICLPEEDADYKPGRNCTISGFGSTQTGKSTSSHVLRAGWVPLQPPEVCKLETVYGKTITEGMLCAGNLDEGVDSCDGDSGGPLACLDKGLFTLYGLTSWGQHCGHANKPGVYVKIAHYRDWIDKKIEENS